MGVDGGHLLPFRFFDVFFASGIVNSKPGPTQNPSVAMPGATATRDSSGGRTAEVRGPCLGENGLQRRDFSGFSFQWGRNLNQQNI